MAQLKTYTQKEYSQASSPLLKAILGELRLLRKEVTLLFSQEDLKDYSHPARIKRSYEKAIKQYPPLSSL